MKPVCYNMNIVYGAFIYTFWLICGTKPNNIFNCNLKCSYKKIRYRQSRLRVSVLRRLGLGLEIVVLVLRQSRSREVSLVLEVVGLDLSARPCSLIHVKNV